MDLVREIVGRYFSINDGELQVGGLPISEIVREVGTPVFVYDSSVLETKLRLLRAALPSRFQISFSVKANPAQEILKFFVARGCGLEIASGGELQQALAAGCSPDRIIFAGPGKTLEELEDAVRLPIKEIHVESPLELKRIQDLCRRRGCRANVALRVNPNSEAQGGAMRMGGKPAPFGIDEECLDPVVRDILGDSHLVFRGIHLFTGTQILDCSVLLTQYRKALEIARRIGHGYGCSIHTVDFGGGLGIPYFPGERFLDLQALHSGLQDLEQEIATDPVLCAAEMMVEPGRFLAGEAGIYVTRIHDIKISRNKKFLILDGGMNHHLAASGNLGQTIKRNYPHALLTKMFQPARETVEISGPLCTPLDLLARNTCLPPAEAGDLVGIFQSGAYGRSASPLGFLSHPSPPELLVNDRECLVIRRRGQVSDYLNHQQCAVSR